MAALKVYRLPNGMKCQFEEGKQPAGAVEAKPAAAKRAPRPKAQKKG